MATRIGKGRRPHLYIKEWMEYRGLSDKDMGARIGVHRETIWRWHTQQSRLRPEKVAVIAEALQLESDQLYRPPSSRPSLDALIKDAPPDVQDLAVDLVTRLVKKTG